VLDAHYICGDVGGKEYLKWNKLSNLESCLFLVCVCQVGDQFGEADKQFYLSLTDHDVQHKVRELNANRIGQLVRISGQVWYITLSTSVPDPNTPGSEIINFGSCSGSPLFHTELWNISKKIIKKWANSSLLHTTHLCLDIDQNWQFFSPSLVNRRIQDPDPKIQMCILKIWMRN